MVPLDCLLHYEILQLLKEISSRSPYLLAVTASHYVSVARTHISPLTYLCHIFCGFLTLAMTLDLFYFSQTKKGNQKQQGFFSCSCWELDVVIFFFIPAGQQRISHQQTEEKKRTSSGASEVMEIQMILCFFLPNLIQDYGP